MTDKALRQDIIDELNFEPSIDAAKIGVAVEDGVVTLTGHVPNCAQKYLAEAAVRRVKGVRGIVEALKVKLVENSPYSDADVARRALTVLDLNVLVPTGDIQIKVERGWLTLTGEVEWDYQRAAAIHDLRKMRGVAGIRNNVTIHPGTAADDIQHRIECALKRNASIRADGVKVSIQDGAVMLEGQVDSWADRKKLERAAWSVPGVRSVEDRVVVL